MISRLYKTILTLLILAITSTAYALTIENQNSKSVSYEIWPSSCIGWKYSEGQISKGGTVTWTEPSLLSTPTNVCVYVRGWSSTFGSTCKGVNVEHGKVIVKNAGFARGIKCETVA